MVTYRIRYRKPHGKGDGEVVVEAASPTEAMVKFENAWDGGGSGRLLDVVTSVRAEDDFYCAKPGA